MSKKYSGKPHVVLTHQLGEFSERNTTIFWWEICRNSCASKATFEKREEISKVIQARLKSQIFKQ